MIDPKTAPTIPWQTAKDIIQNPLASEWPLAGIRLDKTTRNALGITDYKGTLIKVVGPKNAISEYTLTNDYLVPRYEKAAEEDINKFAEEFTLDRVRRFFYTAEPQLDVRWTRDAINNAKDAFEASTDPHTKDIKARFLVGMMVNRMERLSRAFFQGDLQGTKIDLNPAQREALVNAERPLAEIRALRRIFKTTLSAKEGEEIPRLDAINKALGVFENQNFDDGNITLTHDQREALESYHLPLAELILLRRIFTSAIKPAEVKNEVYKRLETIRTALQPFAEEFYEDNLYLTTPQEWFPNQPSTALTDLVHMRDGKPDRDGILSHLVREMRKMWGFEEADAQAFATANVVDQIGYAMSAIDETKNSMLAMLRNPKVLTSLTAAAKEYKDSLPEEAYAVRALLDGGAAKLIEKYANISRARTGIKSDDAVSFGDLRERVALMDIVAFEVHKRMRTIGRTQNDSAISEAKDILIEGFELMQSMGQLRIPRNRFAPAFSDKNCKREPKENDDTLLKDNANDQSSVRRFERSVEKWLNKNPAQSQGMSKA